MAFYVLVGCLSWQPFLIIIYIKCLKKHPYNESIQNVFVQDKYNGFLIIKTYFLNCYVMNCGGDEKVNFPFFMQKIGQLVGDQPIYMSFR